MGERVSPAPNDKQQLVPTLAAAAPVAAVLADSGFYRDEAVQAIERTAAGAPSGTIVYLIRFRCQNERSVESGGSRRLLDRYSPG